MYLPNATTNLPRSDVPQVPTRLHKVANVTLSPCFHNCASVAAPMFPPFPVDFVFSATRRRRYDVYFSIQVGRYRLEESSTSEVSFAVDDVA